MHIIACRSVKSRGTSSRTWDDFGTNLSYETPHRMIQTDAEFSWNLFGPRSWLNRAHFKSCPDNEKHASIQPHCTLAAADPKSAPSVGAPGNGTTSGGAWTALHIARRTAKAASDLQGRKATNCQCTNHKFHPSSALGNCGGNSIDTFTPVI